MNAVVSAVALAQIIARNVTPLVGILFFQWSASNVLVLYFLDTLLSMAVIFAGLAKSFSPPVRDGVAARINAEAGYVLAALLICAFMAVPLGIPVGIALAVSGFSFRIALADHSLRVGLLVQCAMALWSYITLYRALNTHSPSELKLKQRFGLVLMRWVMVLVVCYAGLGFLGSAGVFILVATYIAASIFAEIAPDRFLRGTPGAFAEEGADRATGPAAGASTSPDTAGAKGRKNRR